MSFHPSVCYFLGKNAKFAQGMEHGEDSGSPGWRESFFNQTRRDAFRNSSPRPSIMFSSVEDTGGQLQKLKQQLSRVLRGFSPPPLVKTRSYNPEVLTIQKRLWANKLLVNSIQMIVSST